MKNLDKKYLVLIMGLFILSMQFSYMNKLDKELKAYEVEAYTDMGTSLKLLGIKRFGTAMLWIRQTLYIGETLERDARKDIRNNAFEIARLNPYFLENYYASSVVLGLIRTYTDYEGAMALLELGMEYNKDDRYLINYYGGIVASAGGDNEEIIKNFEGIIEKYPDPLLINILVGIYDKKFEETRTKEDFDKLMKYSILLYETGIERYVERVEGIWGKIEELTIKGN